MLKAIGESAQAEGAVKMRSQHSVLNNNIIIIKLALGWHITGLTNSEQMGSLVELSYRALAKKEIEKHRKAMVGLYIGACVGAGIFTLLPTRYLGGIVWSYFGLIN